MIEYKETYEDFGRDIEVFKCSNCGKEHHILAGGDIACCPCEFDETPYEEAQNKFDASIYGGSDGNDYDKMVSKMGEDDD